MKQTVTAHHRSPDVPRVSTEVEARRGTALLRATAGMAKRLATALHWRDCLPDILRELGQAAEVQRSFLFEIKGEPDRDLSQTCIADWAAEGLHSLSRDPRNLDESLIIHDPTLAEWVVQRSKGRMIEGLTRDLDGYLRQDFEHQGIKSFLSVPIMVQGRWWGHLGLDDCEEERLWSDAEKSVIQAAALLIAGTVERELVEERARASQALSSAVIAHSLDAIIVYDGRGRISDFNPAAERLFGWQKAEVIGKSLEETLVPPQIRNRFEARLQQWLAHAPGQMQGSRFETEARRRNGHVFPAELTVIDVGVTGRAAYAAQIRDISERTRVARELETLAYEDQTTGLPNRAGLVRRLSATAQRGSVLAVDLAGLGEIKATFGIGFFNAVMRALALRLVGMLGRTALLGRIGDHALALYLPEGIASREGGTMLAQMRTMFTHPFAVDGRRLYLAARIGYAEAGMAGAEEALRDAELAMRLAEPGREPVAFCSALREERLARLEWETALRAAAMRPEEAFELHYQPIRGLGADKALLGFEALLRWRHPGLGLVQPLDFVPLAELTGLIVPIGAHVLRSAARTAADWAARYGGNIRMGINLSAVQLGDAGIVEELDRILDATGLDAGLLKFEVTETAVMTSAADAVETMTRLRERGAELALDDFGTGYSSLAMLRQLPVDVVKIDRSFVQASDDRASDSALLRAILRMARDLGLQTIAEGVETEEEEAELRELNCDFAQGWLYGRPMPRSGAEALLDSARR